MKKWLIFAGALFLGLSVTACAGASGFSNETVRYKMTVTVDTPEGIKIGSAVREAARNTEPSILPEQGGTSYNIIKGEAVVIELGQRGILFVLLGGEREARNVFKHFYKEKGQLVNSSELTYMQYPKLVNFKDRNDPKTIELVLETESCADPKTGIPRSSICIKKDRFEEIYGEGVRLKSITIEKTEDEVTRRAGKYMPSYKDQVGYMKWFRTLPYDDPRAVNANDFGSIGGIQ